MRNAGAVVICSGAQDAAKRGGLQNCDATRNSLWPWRWLRHTATSASPGCSGWPVAQGCQNLRDEQHFRLGICSATTWKSVRAYLLSRKSWSNSDFELIEHKRLKLKGKADLSGTELNHERAGACERSLYCGKRVQRARSQT